MRCWVALFSVWKQRTGRSPLYPHVLHAYIPTMSTRPASAATSAIVEADTTIDVAGRAMQARVYGKRKPGSAVPVVLHFHGGAFVSGDLDSGACMARLLAEVGVVVVSVAYPLAP